MPNVNTEADSSSPVDDADVGQQTSAANLPATTEVQIPVTPLKATRHVRALAHPALVVIALIAVVTVIHIAGSLLLPILVAALLALLLNPPVRWLSTRWLPRWLAAFLVLGTALSVVTAAGVQLYQPAMEAAAESPRAAHDLKRKLARFNQSFAPADAVGEALDTIDAIGAKPAPREVTVVEDERSLSKRYGGMLTVAGTAGTITVLVFLFLVYGEMLFRRIVVVAPTLADKRNTVGVVRGIQSEVSRYVGTITVINIGLGGVVALAMYGLGVNDPLLWGGAAALLNFAPYVGPFIGFVLLLLVGILQFDTALMACAPAAAFLALNIVESQLITPVVLGRSFSLNPVVILIWLLFWGWLWGVPGVLLAMPLLVCGKIVCLRSEALRPWAQILER